MSSSSSSSFFVSALLAIVVVLFTIVIPAPFAAAEEVSYTIDEEVGAGFVVGNVAVDLAIPLDANTQFSMLTVPNETYFTLDAETGELTTTEHIDREVICPGSPISCEMEVDVFVQRSQPMVINIKIAITDINDHAPTFASDVTDIQIPESVATGTTFPLVPATDGDTGTNAVQEYRLSDEPENTFGLIVDAYPDGTMTISLKVLVSLDREVRDNYQLTLYADDGGNPPLSGVTILNVTVLDSDDHSPVFERSTYRVGVAEDTPVGTEIQKVKATDPDTGTNGQILYSFGGSVSAAIRDMFDIDSETGSLTVKSKLDYEEQPSYQVVVRATNNVPNPVPDFATVTVDITDVNDNRPKLTITSIATTGRVTHIPENGAVDQAVAFVRVSDNDGGLNGVTTLTLEDDEGHFYLEEINDDQYLLKTTVSLDREEFDEYNITILAQDGGSPALTSRQRFGVIVDDENDNAPGFRSSLYHATISENNEPGHRVATVQAFDDDEFENGEVVYSLLNDMGGSFSINPVYGILTANKSLDREVEESIGLHIRACDRGDPQRCSDVPLTVKVLDQNDNSPDFGGDLIEMEIRENRPVGTYVGRAVAEDADAELNGRITYSIITDSLFRIDEENGRVYSEAELDRETQELYHFTVRAVDDGLSPKTASATVVVTVRDDNDHDPQFVLPSLNDNIRFIPASASAGFPIIRVVTEDRDRDANAAVSYSIASGNDYGSFGIQALGSVVTAQDISPSLEGVHEIEIRATDSGTSPRSSTMTLRIVVANEDFGTSLPPANFTALFNLTIEHYLMMGGGNSANSRGILDDWPMIVIISLAGCAVVLVIVFLVVAAKCRTKNREQGKYIVPSGEDLFALRQGGKPPDIHPGKAPSDTDSGLTSMASNISSIPSKNIQKWRAQQDREMEDTYGPTASHRGSASNLGNNGTVPAGILGATSMDLRLGNRQMSTFGSNSDLHSESIASITSARRTPDPDAEVQRLLRNLKLQRETDIISDHNSEGNGSGGSYDSGHGGDKEIGDTDGVPSVWTHQNKSNTNLTSNGDGHSNKRSSSYPRIAALAAQNVTSGPTPPGGHRHSYMASPNCTPECLTLGHSDECWMPTQGAIGKSKSVHFSKYDANRSSGGSYRSYQAPGDRPMGPTTAPKPSNPAIAYGNTSKGSQNHKPLPKGTSGTSSGSGAGMGQPTSTASASIDLNLNAGYYTGKTTAILDDVERNGMPLTPIREHPSERRNSYSLEQRSSTPSVIVTMHSPAKYEGTNGNGGVNNRTDKRQQKQHNQDTRVPMNGVSPSHKNNGTANGGLGNGSVPNGLHNGSRGRSESRNSNGDSRNSSVDSYTSSSTSSSGAGNEMSPVRYSPDEVEAVLEKCGGELTAGVSPEGDRMYTDWV